MSNEGEWISYAGSRGRNNEWNLHTQRNINTEVFIYGNLRMYIQWIFKMMLFFDENIFY